LYTGENLVRDKKDVARVIIWKGKGSLPASPALRRERILAKVTKVVINGGEETATGPEVRLCTWMRLSELRNRRNRGGEITGGSSWRTGRDQTGRCPKGDVVKEGLDDPEFEGKTFRGVYQGKGI